MTDKQIIYDDVDVKDCIAYAKLQTVYLGDTVCKQMEKLCMVKNLPCKFFDCQFKQMARELKAKEQECEELKDRIDNIRDFAKQGRDMFVEQGSFADWYKVAEYMKNNFNFILYEIDDEE